MPRETIRVLATSEARSQALLAALDGVCGVAFSHDGVHEVHIRLDATTAASLVQCFHAVGVWLADGNEASCEIHFGARSVNMVAPIEGKAPDATRFLLERTIQLQTALESGVVIDQATGMFAERIGVSLDEAFSFLRSAARSQGLDLPALAAELIHSPETPPELARVVDIRPA
ncbi:MAG: ANTAR domain-containing protein [Actinomycetota bacterium]